VFVLIGLALVIVATRSPATGVSGRPRQRSIAVVVTPAFLVGLGLLGGGPCMALPPTSMPSSILSRRASRSWYSCPLSPVTGGAREEAA